LKSFEQKNLVIFVLKVGRTGLSSLAESGQKTLKVDIHSQGRWQKNFQGPNGKRPKNSKKKTPRKGLIVIFFGLFRFYFLAEAKAFLDFT